MPARYAAFISYSHSDDARLAPALQAALHKFAKPWWSRRAVRVFRDETNLVVNPDLFGTIIEALDASDHFILLASPQSAASEWVGREVGHWIEHKDVYSLLIIVTDGDIAWDEDSGDFDWLVTTTLPPVLKGVFKSEPLWLDLRWTKSAENFSPRDPRFLDTVARISAVLRNVSLDEIAGEEVRQHRRTRITALSALTAIIVFALAAVGAAWLAYEGQKEAERQTAEARRQFSIAIDAVDTLIKDVAQPLHDTVGVPIGVTVRILKRTESVIDRLEKTDDVPEVVLRRARLMFVFARVYHRFGMLEESRKSAEKAIASLSSYAVGENAGTEFRLLLSMAYNLVGDAEMDRFAFEGATEAYRRAFKIRKRLSEDNPGNAKFTGHLAASYLRFGDVARGIENPVEAARNYRAAVDLYEIITEVDKDPVWVRRKAYVLRYLGLVLGKQQRWKESMEVLDRAYALISGILENKKHQAVWQLDLSLIGNFRGEVHLAQDRIADAVESHNEALGIQEELLRKDKENRLWQQNMALTRLSLATALMRGNCSAEAFKLLRSARIQLRELVNANPRHFKVRYDLFQVERRLADYLARVGDKDRALNAYQQASRHLAKLIDATADNTNLDASRDEINGFITALRNSADGLDSPFGSLTRMHSSDTIPSVECKRR